MTRRPCARPALALVLLGLLPLVVLAPAARADVSYQLLQRSLTGFVTVSLPDSFATANEQLQFDQIGMFDESVDAEAGVEGSFGRGLADQASDIGPTGFSATGSIRASAHVAAPDDFAEGFAGSSIEVHFTVDQPTVLTLTGTLRQVADDGRPQISLLGPGEVLLYLITSNPAEIPFDQSFALEPGLLYRFSCAANGFGQAFEGTLTAAQGSFDVLASFSGGVDAPAVAAAADGPIVAPNPVRSFARILQPVSGARFDEVLVVDVAGRMVRRLEAGGDATTWDVRDASGARVPSGVYFLRLRGADDETVKRVQVLR